MLRGSWTYPEMSHKIEDMKNRKKDIQIERQNSNSVWQDQYFAIY